MIFFFLLVNWVNRDKSLREQGIDETQVLILRKRLFFTDVQTLYFMI